MDRIYSFKPLVFTKYRYDYDVDVCHSGESMYIHCDDKNLYIFLKDDCKINRFNLLSNQWKSMRIHNCLLKDDYLPLGTIYLDNFVIVVSVSDQHPEMLLHYCNLKTENCITLRIHDNGPQLISNTTLLLIDKYLYTVGVKRDNKFFDDIYRINITGSKKWELVYCFDGVDADKSHSLADNFTVHHNGIIYFFNEHYLTHFRDDPKLLAFDLEKKSWKTIITIGDESNSPNFPEFNQNNRCYTQYKDPQTNDLKIFFAKESYCFRTPTLDSIWELSLSTLKWKCLGRFSAQIPALIYCSFMCVSPSGRFFKYGGIREFYEDMLFLDRIVYSTWVVIPKLTDICWEALSHYFPHLGKKSKKEIQAIGLPWNLVEPRMDK